MTNMRNYRRSDVDRPRLNLVRGADGRLKPSDGGGRVDFGVEQMPIRPVKARPNAQASAHKQTEHKIDSSPSTHPAPSAVGSVAQLPSQDFAKNKKTAAPARTFKLPRISLPRPKRIKKVRFVVVGATLAVAVALGATGYILGGRDKAIPHTPTTNAPDTKKVDGPEFSAVLPKGKTIEDLGGWVRVSPADKDPVFAFVDVVNDVQLNVSQQQLPENLRTNTAQKVEELAKGFAANEEINANGVVAYLGTSIRGPQSVIFVKNDLLILIKSSSQLANQQWIDYIGSLN